MASSVERSFAPIREGMVISSPLSGTPSNLSPVSRFSNTPSSRGSSGFSSPDERMFAVGGSTGSSPMTGPYRRIKPTQQKIAANAEARAEIHDIKNGANAVVGAVDELDSFYEQNENRIPEDIAKNFRQILERTKLASHFLFHLCKKNLGGSNWETYDLKEIAPILNSLAASSLDEKEINLKWFFSPSISSKIKGPSHYWITRVLLNFLNNAIQYSKRRGEIQVEVKDVEQKGDGFKVRFSVRDQGRGMEPKEANRLFAKDRLPGVAIQVGAKDQGGTGLGLSTCIQDVAQMNFADPDKEHIGAASDGIGKGSTFWFDAPFSRVEEKAAIPKFTEMTLSKLKPTASAEIGSGQTTDFSGLNVLIVDDNDVNQKLFGRILDKLKVGACKFAKNGREAFEQVATGEYNLVFMDLEMPDMDGRKSAQMIRQYERDFQKHPIRIVLCSANAGELLPEANGKLPKPVCYADVKKICEQFNIPSVPIAVPATVSSSETDSVDIFFV